MHREFWFGLVLSLFASLYGQVGQSPTAGIKKDPQALALLNESLGAGGGLSVVSSVQDYTASGTITFAWPETPIQAPVTVYGLGLTGFRFDASLQEGVYTWAATAYSATLITPDGNRHLSAPYNVLNAASLTLPYVRVASALTDSTTSIYYMGPTSTNGTQVYQVHFVPSPTISIDPNNSGLEVGANDVYIDPSTLRIVSFVDVVRSETNFQTTYSHEIDFSNYQTVGNLVAPFTIAEKVGGQQTWCITLSSISFNSGLNETIFTP